ncbi:hypothetical protein [Streptomyces sp. NPDC059256]|uniref:hypothetical protein n=1 Tax=Streptomyces sp. NPDC059256 TaxID=3346794 RepID=UPI0036B156E6
MCAPTRPDREGGMCQEFAVGAVVWDAEAKRVGVVMDFSLGSYFLRPLGGGREWSVSGENLSVWSRGDRPGAAEVVVSGNGVQEASTWG